MRLVFSWYLKKIEDIRLKKKKKLQTDVFYEWIYAQKYPCQILALNQATYTDVWTPYTNGSISEM